MSQSLSQPLRVPQNTPFKSAYSEKLRVQNSFPESSPYTKQSFKEECDINTIMRKYQSTGEIPNLAIRFPQYMDVDVADFQSSMQFIAGAKTMFNELPSHIREKFANEPAMFLEFVSQEKNYPEMAEMGLLRPDFAASILNPAPEQKTALTPDKGVSDTPAQTE